MLLVALVLAETGVIVRQQQRADREEINARVSEVNLRKAADDSRSRMEDLQKHLVALREQLAKIPPASSAQAANAARTARNLNAFRASLRKQASPEGQRLRAIQTKAGIRSNFADLFLMLRLPPDRLERLQDLMVEKEVTAVDVRAEAAEHGITNEEDIRQLRATNQAEAEDRIKAVLGDEAYAQFQYYQKTQAERSIVKQLQASVSYTDAPLTEDQGEQLVKVLTQNIAPLPADSQTFGGFTVRLVNGQVVTQPRALVNDVVLAQAQSFLGPAQLDTLRSIQQQQQATVEMDRLMQSNGP